MEFTDLEKAAFISIESYYPNGRAVRTPVWHTFEKGKTYVWTSANSYKIKRILKNPLVRVCMCNAAGKPLSDWVQAHAAVNSSPEAVVVQEGRMKKKYGFQYWLVTKMQRRSAPPEQVVLEISPSESMQENESRT